MNGMNTKEMLDIALALAGLDECPADTAEIVPGENIKKVLAGLDINNPELGVGKVMGYDCVVGHHTRTEDLKGCSKLMETLPAEYLTSHGISPIEVERVISGRAAKADRSKNAMDHNREAMGARTLGLPFMTIMSPACRIAEKTVQQDMDARFAGKPFTTLGEIVEALKEYPETKAWSLEPKALVGDPESHAGKIAVMFTGLSECVFMDGYNPELGDAEIFKSLFRHGVGTLIVKYLGADEKKAIIEQKIGNVVCIGHMVADSIGMNRIIAAWEEKGLTVDKFSGILG